jgi:hypothetical protein
MSGLVAQRLREPSFVRLVGISSGAGKFTVHNLLIANNNTGTLYLVMFEAPSAEWTETWKIAEPMLKYLYIDDAI